MFSMTLCFASTSQAPTRTAPAAPLGRIRRCADPSTSRPIASKLMMVNAVSTPPPSAISTK